ncbi:ABC transporter substrate-binding protein [Tsukamurella soli]|uniref:ABC transporter substrate-binding protein n=1 Tax=Tsukamurella soli TaxID=644556 RepID=UPI00360BE5CE
MLDDLASGAADIALGGLWVPGMYAGTSRELVVFAQLNHRFPKALVTRDELPEFDWAALAGRTVLAPGIGGSAPYAITAGLIRAAGADPAETTFLRDLSTPMFVELFRAGLGDAIVLDMTTAQLVVEQGEGHVAVDYASAWGVGPNSVYYCRADRFEELSDRLVAFTTALSRAMDAIAQSSPEDLGPLLRQHWPSLPEAVRQRACRAIQLSGTWDTVVIEPEGVERWMGVLADERMVRSAPTFADLVCTDIVDRIPVPSAAS